MMPKIVSKSHGPHVLRTTPAQHKKKKKKTSREYWCGIGQIPFEGQVRELFTTLEYQSWGQLCVP